MASSSNSAPTADVAPFLHPFRDASGFLPLVPCSKCGTKLIGRVSQKKTSKGRRFYKCPLLEHTDFACGSYYFEEDYVEYLVKLGHLPQSMSRIRTLEEQMGLEMVKVKDGHELLKAAVEGVDNCSGLLQSAIMSLKDAQTQLKNASDAQAIQMERIGERLLILGLANLVVVVLVLLILICK